MSRSKLDPEAPILPLLAKGYLVGPYDGRRCPWAICALGDGLLIAVGGQEIEVSTAQERDELYRFTRSLLAAISKLPDNVGGGA